MTWSGVYGGTSSPDVGERAAVAHRLQWRARGSVEAEEPPYSVAVEAMPLGQGVFARASGHAVDDGLGHQQAVDDTLR